LENFDITLQQREQWYNRPIEKDFFRADEITAEPHEHVFDSDGGSCRSCGKTIIELLGEKKFVSPLSNYNKLRDSDEKLS
jgi:methionyl-tRNA synthetase